MLNHIYSVMLNHSILRSDDFHSILAKSEINGNMFLFSDDCFKFPKSGFCFMLLKLKSDIEICSAMSMNPRLRI